MTSKCNFIRQSLARVAVWLLSGNTIFLLCFLIFSGTDVYAQNVVPLLKDGTQHIPAERETFRKYTQAATTIAGFKEALPPKSEFVEGTVTSFNLNYLSHLDLNNQENVRTVWDHIHTVATLQGIVNRTGPLLYLFYIENEDVNIDRYWWDKYRQPGKWISKAKVNEASDVLHLVESFKSYIKGVVVYDPKVAATSNIASSVAGAEDLIAIRYDTSHNSLYTKLVLNGPKLPVMVWLVNKDGSSRFTGTGKVPETERASSGSTKIDAYYWLIEKYLKPGKLNTRFGACYIDQFWLTKPEASVANHHTLTNHDFFVSRKGFFFDLSPWSDEATDDPKQSQGADRQTMEEILLLAYRQNNNGKVFTHIGGFPSWAYKYTKHAGGIHEDVSTEWEYSRIIGAYNAFMDADAIGYGALANASFWQHYPLKKEYPQKWTTKEELQAKGYLDANGKLTLGNKQLVIFYVGDYDAASWLAQTTPFIWDNAQRGKTPMMWCISPALAERVPMALDYQRESATANDYFAAADNGAGYLNPGDLQTPRLSGLPDGTSQWAEHCKPRYEQWGLSITGFVIDGFAEGLNTKGLDAYSSFSPNGIVPQKIPLTMLHKDMPILRADWDVNDSNPKVAAAQVVERVNARPVPFHWFRNILKSPDWYVQVEYELKVLNPNIELVDAPTFFELYRLFLKENITHTFLLYREKLRPLFSQLRV
ncbi:MAG: hypothetical protein LBM08_14675 [Dysgonamonadaceae bacterium]|nr:hypothetical protein [Dysgonamonadaceae bacterium]